MESNWRYNVAANGMVDTDWKLCARMRGVFDGFWLVSFNVPGIQTWHMYFPLPVDDPLTWQFFQGGSGPGHFPFGMDVDPD